MQSKHLAKLAVLVGAIAVMAVFAPLAQAREPAPGYTQFAGCQSPEENAETSSCQRSVVKSGFVKMGSKNVPIEKPITLTGGTNEFLEHFTWNSKGGLTKVPQKVPGGVVGLTGLTWLLELLGSEALTLYAVTELAATTEPVVLHSLNSFTLKVKIHLVNATLGNNCYVGTNSNPIVWNLTTGTTSPPPPNTPITGKNAEISFTESPEILFAKNGRYVDNAWSAPGASGCVLTLFGFIPISINGLVNSQSGLPAPAGTNTTEQVIDTEIAGREAVYP
jgi:hypothetical protein